MLRKLLIAICALFVVTACGGQSLNLGPSGTTPSSLLPPPPPPPPEPPPEVCEPTPGESWAYAFESQEDVDAWFMNGDGMNVALSFEQTESAMAITPLQWDSTEENWRRQARTELDEATDLRGATVTAVLSLPESYVSDGAMVLQLVVQGESAYADRWTPVTELSAGENTVVWNIEAGANADLVTHFGIQLSELPEDQTILDPILLRSINVQLPDEDECPSDADDDVLLRSILIQYNGDEFLLLPNQSDVDSGVWDNDNWQGLAGVANLSYDSDEEALVISSNWDVTDESQQYDDDVRIAMYTFAEGVLGDLEGATLTYRLHVPQFYVDNPGVVFEFFIQQADDPWALDQGDPQTLDDLTDLGDGEYEYSRTVTNVPTDQAPRRVGLRLLRGSMDIGD